MPRIPLTDLPAETRARAEQATCPRCGGAARYYDTTHGMLLCSSYHAFRDGEPPKRRRP